MRSSRPVVKTLLAKGRAVFQSTCIRCHSSAPAPESPPAARLRFAPSPTGYLHLGGLRTALFNHLLARKWGGKWLLRIEDTDQSRFVEGAVDSLRHTLEWAGLDYDEGIGRDGTHGPYTQSERLDMYRYYANELLERGEAYECFCTPDDLQAIRASLLKQGHRHGYDGRCRHISRDDVLERKRLGHKHVVRFKSKTEKELLPADLIFGQAQPVTVSTGADDFIIMKSDGWPTYHLASVVDDHLMEISHVLRGEEWLPSVTKHHQLYRAFGWTSPLFGHLPLLINADGSKLSKRTGDVQVESYRQKGYEPEALVNFLALMGWDHHAALEEAVSAAGDRESLPYHTRSDSNSLYEVFSMPQLINAFDIPLINHRRSAVNMSKLDFLNKMTLRRKAGRLGEDGVLVNTGKVAAPSTNEEGREELVGRYQVALSGEKVLHSSVLIKDLDYVGRVFDVELVRRADEPALIVQPRAVRLSDMPMASIFFYLDPVYTHLESESFLKTMSIGGYVDAISEVIEQIELRVAKGGAFDEDLCWDAMHATVAALRLRKKNELTMPMRHALTGRKAGPGIPQVMTVLGAERSLTRLRAGLRHVADRGRANQE